MEGLIYLSFIFLPVFPCVFQVAAYLMLSVTRSCKHCIWGAVEWPSRGECAADSLLRASEGGGDVRVCRRSQNKHIRFSSGRVYWQSLFFKCLGFEWIILHCHLSTGLWWQTSPSLGCREKMPPLSWVTTFSQ